MPRKARIEQRDQSHVNTNTKSHSNPEILEKNIQKREKSSRVINKPKRYMDINVVPASCKKNLRANINFKSSHLSSSIKKNTALVKHDDNSSVSGQLFVTEKIESTDQNPPDKSSASSGHLYGLRNSKRRPPMDDNVDLMKNNENGSISNRVLSFDDKLPVEYSASDQISNIKDTKRHRFESDNGSSTEDPSFVISKNKQGYVSTSSITDNFELTQNCKDIPVKRSAIVRHRSESVLTSQLVISSLMDANIEVMKDDNNSSVSGQLFVTEKFESTDQNPTDKCSASSGHLYDLRKSKRRPSITDNFELTQNCKDLPVKRSADQSCNMRNTKRHRSDSGSTSHLAMSSLMDANIELMKESEICSDNGSSSEDPSFVISKNKQGYVSTSSITDNFELTQNCKDLPVKHSAIVRHRSESDLTSQLVISSLMDANIEVMKDDDNSSVSGQLFVTEKFECTDQNPTDKCSDSSGHLYDLRKSKRRPSITDNFELTQNCKDLPVKRSADQSYNMRNTKRHRSDSGSTSHLAMSSLMDANIELMKESEICSDNGSSSEDPSFVTSKNKQGYISTSSITDNFELTQNCKDLPIKRSTSHHSTIRKSKRHLPKSALVSKSVLSSSNKNLPCGKSRQHYKPTSLIRTMNNDISFNRSPVYNNIEFVNVEPENKEVNLVEEFVESDPMGTGTDDLSILSVNGDENLINYDMVPESGFDESIPPNWSTENENFESIIRDDEETVSTDDETIPAKRTRNRKPNKSTWKREISKTKREHGFAYQGYQRKCEQLTVPLKEKWIVTHDTPRPKRTIGPRCSSKNCIKSANREENRHGNVLSEEKRRKIKSANRHCNVLSEEERVEMHRLFWEEMSWDQKKIFIVGLVDLGSPKKRLVANSRRSLSLKYFLKIGNARKQVCKSFFLSTFSLKPWMVRYWLLTSIHGIIPTKAIINAKRAATRPISQLQQAHNEKRDFLSKFLSDLPKLPSHYCRRRTKKQYLEPNYQSKSQLYEHYKIVCENKDSQPLSICYFSNMFTQMNLSLYKPKKDRCDVCVGHEKGNISVQQFNIHIRLKERARKEKKLDKMKARAGQAHVFVMDVEAVQLAPFSNASALYFKTKLKVHNFSIYNLATKECTCYWWHEGDGEMCAEMFVTCIIKHLRLKCNDGKPIILWSDGCVYQNRNQILSNALLDHAINEDKVIEQKYLVKGHTQMEVDSIHSLIERKIKKRSIDLPSDYVEVTKKARKNLPIEAELLSFNDFLKYDDPSLHRYSSIRPGNKVNDPTVTDLHVLTHNPDGTIRYKINFNDELKLLPRLPKTPQNNYSEIQQAYLEPLKISKRRYNDLQDLKLVLPEKVHDFYDSLSHD